MSCLTCQYEPCLLYFDCINMDAHVISNMIIDYFSKLDYNYIMPDYNVHDYLFCSSDSNNIRCYLFKSVDCQTDEITVCLIPSVRNAASHKIFSCLRDSFRPHHAPVLPTVLFPNMSALDILVKYY